MTSFFKPRRHLGGFPGHAAPPTSSASALGWQTPPFAAEGLRARAAAVAPPFASPPPELPAARCDGPPMPSSAPPLPPPLHSPSVALGAPAILPVSKERASNIAALHSPVEEALEVATRPPQGSPRCDGLSVPSYAPPFPVPPPAHATHCASSRSLRRPIPRVAHASAHRSLAPPLSV